MCYFVQAAFILSVLFKALFTGYYLNPSSTHYNLPLAEDGMLTGVSISDVNIRFGFAGQAGVLSDGDLAYKDFPADIGRFELLWVWKTSTGTRIQQRIPIAACADNANLFCPVVGDMDVYGTPFHAEYSNWVLQVRPCQSKQDIDDLPMTTA